ncbi:MAG: ribosome-associated translation inhibitor RaiA [Chloroflexota bacterium]
MDLIVQGRNVEITEHIQEYVEKKVSRLERHLASIEEVRGELTESNTRSQSDRYTFQLTLLGNRKILRSEVSTGDIFASIDAAMEKMSRQIEKVEGRRKNRRRKASLVTNTEAVMAATAIAEEIEEDEAPRIMRHKRFLVQAMDEDEAQEQLELLGHDFFLYYNNSENAINLLYRRKDGHYGVLQPEVG